MATRINSHTQETNYTIMPGGNKAIRPEDGVQFKKGNKAAEKWTEEKALALGEELIKYLKKGSKKGKDENVFFEYFLVVEKQLPAKLISFLSKKFTSFATLITHAKKMQEMRLVHLGVNNKLNAHVTKFVLQNHHDYSEKQEIKKQEIKPTKYKIDKRSKKDSD